MLAPLLLGDGAGPFLNYRDYFRDLLILDDRSLEGVDVMDKGMAFRNVFTIISAVTLLLISNIKNVTIYIYVTGGGHEHITKP